MITLKPGKKPIDIKFIAKCDVCGGIFEKSLPEINLYNNVCSQPTACTNCGTEILFHSEYSTKGRYFYTEVYSVINEEY